MSPRFPIWLDTPTQSCCFISKQLAGIARYISSALVQALSWSIKHVDWLEIQTERGASPHGTPHLPVCQFLGGFSASNKSNMSQLRRIARACCGLWGTNAIQTPTDPLLPSKKSRHEDVNVDCSTGHIRTIRWWSSPHANHSAHPAMTKHHHGIERDWWNCSGCLMMCMK